MTIDNRTATSIEHRLSEYLCGLYPGADIEKLIGDIKSRIAPHLNEAADLVPEREGSPWCEQDIMLITYGDTLSHDDELPLATLKTFLCTQMKEVISTVHILPYFPFSSDDGFSVIDYRTVDPVLGDWQAVRAISDEFDLMTDLVINHCSRESLWFLDYLNNQAPGVDYFVEADPNWDLSSVVRPRNTPLLAPIHTPRGLKHVWATFSEDQLDLDFKNPAVLLEFLDILFEYVTHGSRFVRLDAIAFLWKEVGTSSIHLPQTHAVVQLLRLLLEHYAPGVILLTETNVPVQENLSYFGDGHEAQMVYQFGLPPLLLHALNRGTGKYLTEWAAHIPPTPDGCTYLNFTASHDGIGVRAVEGILPPHEVADLVECMHQFGGFVTMRSDADGAETPYEINISLFDALQGTRRELDQWQIQRFLCSQAIMLALQGIPAVYFHSLTATPNDRDYLEQTGRLRSINRKKWQYNELFDLLHSPQTATAIVFEAYKNLCSVRRKQPAFHPDASQQVLQWGDGLFALLRENNQHSRLLAVHNLTAHQQVITCGNLCDYIGVPCVNVLTGHEYVEQADIVLHPYECLWLIGLVDTDS
ncbi:MAG: sugar phosphorylase [Pseudomonadales bacterium]|nr:sugar phosphorylase [Pseudomonadales bacterium]